MCSYHVPYTDSEAGRGGEGPGSRDPKTMFPYFFLIRNKVFPILDMAIYSLFIVAPIACVFFLCVLGPCFVMQRFVF